MRRSRRPAGAFAVVLMLLAALAGLPVTCAFASGGAALESSAALTRALHGRGHGEATLRYSMPGLAGAPRPVRARLALELPALARLDVVSTGEHIVLRADGGEWLQPATRQLVRFAPRQATPALRWWSVLLGLEPAARERRLSGRRFEVVLPASGANPADTAEVLLDAGGLPARLATDGMRFRLAGWQFTRARGDRAFRLAAPAGYETVDLP